MKIIKRDDRAATGDSFFTRLTFESAGHTASKTIRIYSATPANQYLEHQLQKYALEAERDIWCKLHPGEGVAGVFAACPRRALVTPAEIARWFTPAERGIQAGV